MTIAVDMGRKATKTNKQTKLYTKYEPLISYQQSGVVLVEIAMAQPQRWKRYAHKGDYSIKQIFSSVCPFSKWELLLKERISSQRERILFFMSSSL